MRFGDQTVVEGVDLVIDSGESVGLIGGSGSGKTLTALAVLGLLPRGATASGSITIDGTEILGTSESFLRRVRGARIGFVGQDSLAALNPLVTVGRHLDIPLRRHRGLSRRAARAAAHELLERVGLPAGTHAAYPAQISGGQRQRVAIAMAVAARPAILIADEPTSALDPPTQAEILGLLRDLPQATDSSEPALLLISHDLAVVSQICTRLAVMHDGRLAETGATTALIEAPHHPYTRALVASARALSGAGS